MGIFRRKDSPYWWYKVQLGGKRWTGSTNTSDRRLAQRIHLEKHHQFVEEHHIPSLRGKKTRLFQMCDLYMDKHAKVNKRSWRYDAYIVGKLKEYFGDVPLLQVRPETIESYKGRRLGYVQEARINRELAVLKTIFSKAVLWGYAARNPVKEVRLFKEERIPIKILSQEERDRLFKASPGFLRPILLLALKTGMRQGEIIHLKWDDVDLKNETINVRQTKSKKLRQVPIHPQLNEMLERLPKSSAYVFPDASGGKMSRTGKLRDAFERLKKEAGLPDLTFHALRHNFASELVGKGVDLRTVQEYLGHSSLAMLERYAHVTKGIWRSSIHLLGSESLSGDATLALRGPSQKSQPVVLYKESA